MSKEKGKDLSDYGSPVPDHDSAEEGNQIITSNIQQLMTGKIILL